MNIITSLILSVITFIVIGNTMMTVDNKRVADIDDLKLRLDAAELSLAAKIPEPIKFYRILGYSCNTESIPGHCSNLNITQAEYDKKNAHLFNVTDNQEGN